MREIKFRVWDIKNKCWCRPEIEFIPYQCSDNKDMYLDIKWGEETGPKEQDYVFCQFTGLKDKNGKEIYEGDILTSENYPFDEGNYLIEVSFDTGTFFGYVVMTKKGSENVAGRAEGNSINPEEFSNFEIIGNIYENPNLLNKEKNETN